MLARVKVDIQRRPGAFLWTTMYRHHNDDEAASQSTPINLNLCGSRPTNRTRKKVRKWRSAQD